ncbi:MAG: RNA polymerase sigma factor [Candidatus Promineifilaceae bacterium]|nr:RNA polymerase sigma factor [Candidatus Promineifilaceae bacterium]
MTAKIEHVLLQRAQQGIADAFSALRYYLEPEVHRYIWHVIGHTEAEDDMVQDVFTALYLNLEKIRPVEKLKPFLFRVTRNRCYDLLRYQGRRRVVPLSADVPAKAPPLEEETHVLLRYRQVKAAMDQLPEPQKQVLVLYAEEEFSYEEIAIALKINIGTVKSRLHQARKAVKQMIQNPDLFLK